MFLKFAIIIAGIAQNKKPVRLDRFPHLYSFCGCTPLNRGSNMSAPVSLDLLNKLRKAMICNLKAFPLVSWVRCGT